MFKKHNFKIFWGNPIDLIFNLFKFPGKINLHISKLRKKNAANKANNKAINKIAEDFEKNSCSDKIKRIKTIYQKYFTKLQKMKNTQSKIKELEKKLIEEMRNEKLNHKNKKLKKIIKKLIM